MLQKFLVMPEFANGTRNQNNKLSLANLAIKVTLTLVLGGHFAPAQAAQTKQLNNFNNFAEWCLNQDKISPEARHTVEVLLREAKTSDCQEANDNLSKLTELALVEQQIRDIRPLSILTNLTSLHLFKNQISDISPLSTLTNLTHIEIWNNQINDISPLSNLKKLTNLNLWVNKISDLKPLSTLTNLADLNLSENQISDISPLSTLTHLTRLLLGKNQISDLRPLSTLSHLTILAIEENQISDIRPLSTLSHLKHIGLEDNQISDIRPLSTLTNLTSLNLQRNQISDIRPLSTLTNLTELRLSTNKISDIRPLSTLTNLTFLDLFENQISDIRPLSTLTNLTLLWLTNNPLAQKTCPVHPPTICSFSDDGEELYARAQEQYRQGQFQSALATLQEVLAIYQKAVDRKRSGDVLNLMGDSYSNLGQYALALDFYQKVLAIRQELGDRTGEIYTQASLGLVYERLGQYQKAEQVLQNCVKTFEDSDFLKQLAWSQYQGWESEKFDVIGTILNSLASVHNKLGNYSESLYSARLALVFYRKSLSEQNALASEINIKRGISKEANALDAIGTAYWRLGNPERALMFLEKAWERTSKIGDKAGEGRVLNHGGELFFSLGNTQKALEIYQKALPLRQQAKDIAGQGETLNNLGLLYFNQNQYAEAEKYLFDAIKVLEALRPGLKDDEKIAIFETQTVTYRLLQKVLIAQNKYNEALEISDRARARAFVELLAQRFSASDDAQITPLTLEQIQRIAKEQNATLVEYSLVYDDFNINGKQQPEESELYIWVIQPTGEITFRRSDLKPLWQQQKTSLSQIVAEARCFENDACRQKLTKARGVGNIPEIRGGLGAIGFNNAPGQSAAAAQGQQQNRQLQQLHQLLIEPIADILPKDPNNRVIFIPQSSLFLAPFPALQDEKGNYLIEKHTILTAPSIQVLDLTRQQRQKLSPSIKDALVVGNPTMPTIVEFGKPPEKLSPLLGAETEAKEIAQLLNTTPLIGNQATESVVVQKMPSARIIHLATHGSFDPERGIGSWIALAPDSPTSGTPPTPLAKGGVQAQGSESVTPSSAISSRTPPISLSKAGLIDFPAVRPEFKDAVGEFRRSLTSPQTNNDVGALATAVALAQRGEAWNERQHLGDYLSANPAIFISKCFALPHHQAGRSIRIEKSWLNYKIDRPNASPLQNFSVWGLTPSQLTNNFINSLADLGRMNQPCLAQGEAQTGESVRQEKAKGVGDGLLKAEEIVDLKLNAELVALSACDTAQGKITGDGVVGLSRALISAGVPSVLVSLWKVDDNATAFLMREFYQNWQKSPDKAQALRQAMLATKQKQNYSHPRFWAAFTLIGEAE